MTTRKLNVNIYKVIAVTVSVSFVLMLFSHLLPVNVHANYETHSVFNLSDFANRCDHPYSDENNKSENETNSCGTVSCNSSSCCIIMGLHSTSVSINSNGLSKANLSLGEQFKTKDILCSIFKPPKI